MAPKRPPAIGDVYESLDREYEPGRRIQVIELLPDGRGVRAATVAHPRRPHCVGNLVVIRETTLWSRWDLISAGAPPVPVGVAASAAVAAMDDLLTRSHDGTTLLDVLREVGSIRDALASALASAKGKE